MSKFSAKEFADSVRTAIGTVNHLCVQVDRLNDTLRESLTNEPNTLRLLCEIGSGHGKHRNDFRTVRFDYGMLYHGELAEEEEDIDDEYFEEDTDADESASSTRVKKRVVEFSTDQSLLAVRTLLYDHKNPDSLEPQILYAVLGDWRVGDKPPKSSVQLRLKYYMANRILRALHHHTSISPDNRLFTKAMVIGKGQSGSRNTERRLSAQIIGAIQSIPLYDLDGAGAVENLTADIKTHWLQHLSG